MSSAIRAMMEASAKNSRPRLKSRGESSDAMWLESYASEVPLAILRAFQ